MRSRFVQWSVVALSVALVAAYAVEPARPAPAGFRDEDLFLRGTDERMSIFASVDGGRSVFASGGSKQALVGPLDRSGWISMETSGFGLTQERGYTLDGVAVPVLRFTHQTSASIGYQLTLPGIYVAAVIGPELEQEQLTVAGRLQRWSAPHIGGRVQADVWSNPTDWSLVTATFIASSAHPSVYGRVSAGIRLANGVFVGPEAIVYANSNYTETRWGVHVTALPIWRVNVRLSGGYSTDDAHRRGSPYASVAAWIRL